MKQNKLSSILKLVRIISISFIMLIFVIAVSIFANLLPIKNETNDETTQTSELSDKSLSPQPSSAENVVITDEWKDKEKVQIDTGSGTQLQIPPEFLPMDKAVTNNIVNNGLAFYKNLESNKTQYIVISTNKNSRRNTVEEYLTGQMNENGDNLQSRYILYAEKIKNQIAATSEYSTINPNNYIVRTIIYTPPIMHDITIAETIGNNDSRTSMNERLYRLRSTLLSNYNLLSIDIDQNEQLRNNEELQLFQKHNQFYEQNRKK